MPSAERTSIVERFWAKVKKTPHCWLWTAGADTKGYGQFHYRLLPDGRPLRVGAHRYAWTQAHGEIPQGLSVLHHCDTPACVNPNHLFLGTQSDNNKDAAQKDRLTVPRARRLTLAERLEIMAAPRDRATGAALASRFGVSKACICLVRQGRFIGSGVEHLHLALKPGRQRAARAEVA